MASKIFQRQLKQRALGVRIEGLSCTQCRHMTAGEVATALRPFYFSVHPDLFGKFPSERATNENSLQVLSSYIQTLQQNRPPSPATLKFYLRPTGIISGKGSLKPVNIKLAQRDIRKTVVSILSTCNLPTTYVDKIAPSVKVNKSNYEIEEEILRKHGSSAAYENDLKDSEDFDGIKIEIQRTKGYENLLGWLKNNAESAKEKLAACEPIREEVNRLKEDLYKDFGLVSILWDCGWNIAHFRGCLLALRAVIEHHADEVIPSLKGRTLVFGNDTGVSLDGHILLNSGEVRSNWLDFLKNVGKQDVALKTVPLFEKTLSMVLRDIQVVRRKFQPKTMVKQYENNLRRLTTSLSDCQGRGGYPKHWPKTLSDYELVVETEAGPLMVTPTGQFIVPCSCPSFLIVNFISENLEKANQLLKQYKGHKEVEKILHQKCLHDLGLISLDKDDCITPEPMIAFCENLLKNSHILRKYMSGTRITVTNYYSVMSDGQMCIPWNWKLT